MTSSPHVPDPRSPVTRRTFVGAVATTLGVAAVAGRAVASPARAPAKVERAAGLARIRGTAHTLGLTSAGWILVAANGYFRPTSGLDGADVADLTNAGGGLVAVGAVPDGDRSVPTVWESTDGLAWRPASQLVGVDGHLTSVAGHGATALAVGAHLTLERAPRQRLVLAGGASGWMPVPVRGLEYTDQFAATAVGGSASGWLMSTVDTSGSVVSTSSDGLEWTPSPVEPHLVDAAVRSLAVTGNGVRWVANGMGGVAAVTGVLGADRRRVPVPQDAQAIGMLDARSYWLSDGRIVSATV